MTAGLSAIDLAGLLGVTPDWANATALRLERRGVTGLRVRVTGRAAKWAYQPKAVRILQAVRDQAREAR